MLEFAIESIRQTRRNLLRLSSGLSHDQLNTIPEGFRNHIAWHLGHVIAVQQGLCYSRCGLQPLAPAWIMEQFPRGSVPQGPVPVEQLEAIQGMLFSHLDALIDDLAAGKLANFKAYDSSFGIRLGSIEDTVRFLPVHEGTHLGYAMAMRHLV